MINTMGGIAKLFLPLYFLERYRLPYGSIGLLMGCYGLGCVLGAYGGGALSDRLDTRKLCAALLLASGLLTMSLALPLPVWGFVPLLLLTGIADGGFRPGNMRLVLGRARRRSAPPHKGCTGWLQPRHLAGRHHRRPAGGVRLPVGVRGAGLCQPAACGWWRPPPAAAARAGRKRLRPTGGASGSPWQDRAFLRFIAGQLLILAVFDQMYGTLGMFLREHYRLGPEWIGYLFTLNGLMVVALQVSIAHRVGRWGLQRCSHLGVLCIGMSFLLLNAGVAAGWALLAMLVLTIGELLLSPTWSVIVMQRSEGRQRALPRRLRRGVERAHAVRAGDRHLGLRPVRRRAAVVAVRRGGAADRAAAGRRVAPDAGADAIKKPCIADAGC
jgi:hypothetical protein